ncbi:MAG TPA: redoxin domain-containing protein [Myxococcota bacterium]|nr:redoxin domain-containing protein [Myxococcota bacterium]
MYQRPLFSFWIARAPAGIMWAMRVSGLTLILMAAALLSNCKKDEPAGSGHSSNLGIKVIPTGQKPARAPGSKGTMLEMGTEEVRILLVKPGGQAENNSYWAGDVIVAADGKKIASEDDLHGAIAAAGERRIFLEVQRDGKLYTLPLSTPDPGWLVLSGDTFKGFLLTRLQSAHKEKCLEVGSSAPELKLPAFSGPDFVLSSLRGRPVALLFWGTFSGPCYSQFQALAKACRQAGGDLACVAIDTMELFTAVGKTEKYQAEMKRVWRDIWNKGIMPIDIFLESERLFGVHKLPLLLLIDRQGVIRARLQGPLENPTDETTEAIQQLLGGSDDK